MTELKPIDEVWMNRALIYVVSYRRKNRTGPRWRDVADYMGWRPNSCATYFRMMKLAKRGLTFTDESRSLDVSDAGREQMRQLALARRSA